MVHSHSEQLSNRVEVAVFNPIYNALLKFFSCVDISSLNESFFCLGFGSMIPARTLAAIAEHCNEWCGGHQIRIKTLHGKYVFISTDPTSQLVLKYGIGVGERVRTPLGLAELRGVAKGKLWFKYTESGYTWFVTRQQIRAGREVGYFKRCTYEQFDLQPATTLSAPTPKQAAPLGMFFDTFYLQEIMEPARWHDEIDSAIVSHLSKVADAERQCVWDISCDEVRIRCQCLSNSIVLRIVKCTHITYVTY